MAGVVALALLASGAVYRYVTAPLTVTPELAYRSVPTAASSPVLDWPTYGQSAVATPEDGVLATHGVTTPQPTASTAKLITMLALMEKKPFALGSQGELLALNQLDVDLYNNYVTVGGSNVPVVAGETISQYQAMQGVLLASSDNLADSLAIWAFGSLESYREYATRMLGRYGLRDTTIGSDASGLDPATTSTAHDLAVIARHALSQPVVAAIAQQATAELPVVGTIRNTNMLLENEEVVGLKTGFTGEAGGVFVLGAAQTVNAHTHTIIAVVMGAETSRAAQLASYTLYQSASRSFRYQTLVRKGEVIGYYHPAWQSAVAAITTHEMGVFVWPAVTPQVAVRLAPIEPQPVNAPVGRLTVARTDGEARAVPVVLQQALAQPDIWWRIVARPLW